MLAPDDLFVLGEALAPPAGYEVDALIAATYSVDLPMTLALPLAVVKGGVLAGEAFDSVPRVDVIDALRTLVPHYRVFFDASGLYAAPTRRLRVLPLLNEVMVPLAMPPVTTGGTRPAFHPKFIVMRFVAEGNPSKMRAVCMSRNLTSDASLDISVRLEGDEADTAQTGQQSERLADALQHLLGWAVRREDEQRSRSLVDSVAATIRSTRWRQPSEFKECSFWPLGFGTGAGEDPTLLREDENRMLVVSPFLGARRLRGLTARDGRHALVSDLHAIETVGTRALEGFETIYRLAARTGADTHLHAKLYVAEGKQRTRWLVGSVNATGAAVTANAELLVELTGSKPSLRIDKLLGQEEGIGELLIQHVIGPDDPPDEQIDPRAEVEHAMRELTACAFHGVVSEAADGSYIVAVTLAPITAEIAGITASVRLAGTSASEPIDFGAATAAELIGLERRDLSPFLVVNVEAAGEHLERTVVMALEGIDCAELGREALQDSIHDPLSWVAYVLTGIDVGSELSLTFDDEDPAELAAAVAGTATSSNTGSPPLLEKLLQILHSDRATDRSRFVEVGRIIESMEEQLPPELVHLWTLMDRARPT